MLSADRCGSERGPRGSRRVPAASRAPSAETSSGRSCLAGLRGRFRGRRIDFPSRTRHPGLRAQIEQIHTLSTPGAQPRTRAWAHGGSGSPRWALSHPVTPAASRPVPRSEACCPRAGPAGAAPVQTAPLDRGRGAGPQWLVPICPALERAEGPCWRLGNAARTPRACPGAPGSAQSGRWFPSPSRRERVSRGLRGSGPAGEPWISDP